MGDVLTKVIAGRLCCTDTPAQEREEGGWWFGTNQRGQRGYYSPDYVAPITQMNRSDTVAGLQAILDVTLVFLFLFV